MEELLTYLKPNSRISEDFKKLRTSIESHSNLKKILITSPNDGEGKTFVACNLAISLAKNNKKVLLVDCDFNKGRISKIFKVKNSSGLSNLLSQKSDIDDDDIVSKTSIENLYIVFSGTIKDNSSELLSSKKLDNIIFNFKHNYDYIIIDSPCVLNKCDSLVLSRKVDGTILVGISGKTKIDDIKKAKSEIDNVNGKVVGVIINKEDK